ncbi:MAG: N-acetylmuramoyl-L-alanine amidase [Gemmatimonadota bacterium]|nr:MAG: N-acetylmuramoyl-L-alanine amidase [Gemmatimonadota bacterium]
MALNVISYNKASAKELGWDPSWFGKTGFDWELIKAIKAWQLSRGLGADGMIGAVSYRRLLEERAARGLDSPGGISKEVLYNRASATRLGWKPSWFGAERNDEALVELVRGWQRKAGVTADGMVGEASYRRIRAEREARSPVATEVRVVPRPGRNIIYNGEPFPIDWERVVLWNEEGGLIPKPETFRSQAGRPRRPLKCFVNHWDATTSARQCADVLNTRGVSVHFCLDNDGTIYQMVDMQHWAWHAKGLNVESVGVEVSDAFYMKFQDYYERQGFGKRPVISGARVHGRAMEDFLGFYPIQLEALKALWKAVHLAAGIPLQVPTRADGKLIEELDSRVVAKEYRGFVCHYHLNPEKIDCAGLDLVGLVKEVKAELAG